MGWAFVVLTDHIVSWVNMAPAVRESRRHWFFTRRIVTFGPSIMAISCPGTYMYMQQVLTWYYKGQWSDSELKILFIYFRRYCFIQRDETIPLDSKY